MVLAATAAAALMLLGSWGGEASAGETAAGKAKAVDIKNFAFRPARLTIGPGTNVVFTNSSGVSHTATRGGSFNTGTIKPGKSAAVRFAKRGTFAYHCTIHPFMRGKIIVD